MVRNVSMKYIADKMHPCQMLVYSSLNILAAVDYPQSYVDDTLSQDQRQGMREAGQEVQRQAMALIGVPEDVSDVDGLRF